MDDLSTLRFSAEPPSNPSCGLRAALNVVSGKWKPLVLWHLLDGPARFAALRRALGDVAEKVLAEQLHQLESDGIVLRRQISERPLAVEYELSELGRSLVPVLALLSAWGFEHIVLPENRRAASDTASGASQ